MARVSGTGGLTHPERVTRATKPLTLLSSRLLEPDEAWTPLAAGRWRWADHITLGECRAVVKVLDVLTAVPVAHRSKAACPEDNRPTAGAFVKGRSSAPAVNFAARRKAARTLASDIRLGLP